MKVALHLHALALSGFMALTMSASALAQSGTAMTASAPEVRDVRTGKVWTPQFNDQDVNPNPDPNAYVNRSFDPRSQTAAVEGVVVQHPTGNLMGILPIVAGPTVPIVTIDVPSLQAIPGRHWLTILYVSNNSADIVHVVVGCLFTNNGRNVQETRIIVPSAGPGERWGVPVRGPPTDLFVDKVGCRVISPG